MTAAFEIRMDHPSRNALGAALIDWLDARLDEADGRPVLLLGTEAAFCAGLDLQYLAGLDAAGMEAYLRSIDAFASRLFHYPAPVVAAARGHAIAGGCVLMQCCDHRVSVDEAKLKIGVNEVALGACFPPAILEVMRHRLPRPHLERVMLGARLYTPREARDVGLLDEVVADAEYVARRRLEHLATHPAATYALTKRALRGRSVPGPEDERRFVEEEIPRWTSPELRERIRAALAG